jgi:hypothetical protein
LEEEAEVMEKAEVEKGAEATNSDSSNRLFLLLLLIPPSLLLLLLLVPTLQPLQLHIQSPPMVRWVWLKVT